MWAWLQCGGLPEPEKISITANILCAMLGTLLGVSTAAYNNRDK